MGVLERWTLDCCALVLRSTGEHRQLLAEALVALGIAREARQRPGGAVEEGVARQDARATDCRGGSWRACQLRELAADRLGEVLGGKGKAILLRYMVGSESTEQREKGFTDRLKSKFPDIELISDNQYAGATEREAFEKSQNLLTRFTSEAQAIFCPNESSVAGMLSALEQADLAGEIKLIGFDASEKLVTGLEKGHIQGLVLQNPIKMGYLGVKSLVSVINGEKLPEYVDTGVVVATPENMKEPAMVDLHSPDLSKWLK